MTNSCRLSFLGHLFTFLLFARSFASVVSAACYYDSVTGRTICDGLSYGARLAIAAAVTIVGALLLAGFSNLIRKRFSSPQGPPPVSAGYYGPPQTYPPNVAYAHSTFPSAPAPTYNQPPQGPPGYNPYLYQPPNHPPPQPGAPFNPPPA